MLTLVLALAAVQDCSTTMNQLEINVCAQRGFEVADKAMNAQWRATLTKLRADGRASGPDNFGPPPADVLLKSQRAWVAYRDAQCELEGQKARGGQAADMILYGCKETLTKERTAVLKDAAEGL